MTSGGGTAQEPRLAILETKRSHGWAISLMAAIAAVMYGLLVLGLTRLTVADGRSAWSQLRPSQQLDLGCFVFLLSWWIAYFTRSSFSKDHTRGVLHLFTLRSFLDGISSHRGTSLAELETALAGDAETSEQRARDRDDEQRARDRDEKQDEALIREKARSSRDVQGIMIAVVVLLLTLVVIDRSEASAGEYHTLVKGPVFAVAITIILMWVLSLDVFDTMLNSFHVDVRDANELRRHYYRRIGPLQTMSGAVSYGYVGHALMPIFVLMVFSWFEPVLAGFGTALYVLFAYPYYYGYWGVKVQEHVDGLEDVDEDRLPRSWKAKKEAHVIERWVVTRDGDQHVPTVQELMKPGGTVALGHDHPLEDRSRSKIDTQYWPPWVLCAVFLVPSVLVMALST